MSSDNSNDNVKTGLALIEHKGGENVNLAKLQINELGLSVVLLGLAESHAKRIEKLTNIADKLEKEIFNENIITALTDQEKIERYNLAMSTLSASSNYIKNTVNNIDWNSLEIRLRQLTMSLSGEEGSTGNTENNAELKELASNLISELAKSSG